MQITKDEESAAAELQTNFIQELTIATKTSTSLHEQVANSPAGIATEVISALGQSMPGKPPTIVTTPAIQEALEL